MRRAWVRRAAPSPSLSQSSIAHEYINRKAVVDHVGAVVRIVLGWLRQTVPIRGAGQQRMASRLFRRQPLEFPTPPGMLPHRVEEFRHGPGASTIGADCDFRD